MVDLLRAIVNHSDGLLATGRLTEAAMVALGGLEEARRLGLARSYGRPDLACNATEALVALGRWQEADRVSREALETVPTGPAFLALPLARVALELGLGDLDSAEARLQAARELFSGEAPEPQRSGPLFAGLAELALRAGDLEQAGELVAEAVPLVEANPRYAAPLYALGLWVEADRTELARARHPGEPAGAPPPAEHLGLTRARPRCSRWSRPGAATARSPTASASTDAASAARSSTRGRPP